MQAPRHDRLEGRGDRRAGGDGRGARGTTGGDGRDARRLLDGAGGAGRVDLHARGKDGGTESDNMRGWPQAIGPTTAPMRPPPPGHGMPSAARTRQSGRGMPAGRLAAPGQERWAQGRDAQDEDEPAGRPPQAQVVQRVQGLEPGQVVDDAKAERRHRKDRRRSHECALPRRRMPGPRRGRPGAAHRDAGRHVGRPAPWPCCTAYGRRRTAARRRSWPLRAMALASSSAGTAALNMLNVGRGLFSPPASDICETMGVKQEDGEMDGARCRRGCGRRPRRQGRMREKKKCR